MALAVADVAGAFERGRQFKQAEQLRPLQQESARLGLQQQEQALQFGQRREEQAQKLGELQQTGIQQQIDQRTDTQKNQSLFNTALKVDSASDDQIIPILESNIAKVQSLGGDAKESIAALELARAGDFTTVRSGAKNLIDVGVRQGDIKPEQVQGDGGFTLSQGQQRFDSQGRLIASGIPAKTEAEVEKAQIPQVLLEGLDPEISPKVSAAFTAAGGGKDGLKAAQDIIDKGTEQQRRLASPAIISTSFPQASEAETVQLQSAMDAAKTTEAGLKAAGKVREDQRRTKKAQGFQTRAIELLDSILGSDELDDVLGSVEGAIDFRLQDSEAELIADIEEAGNILTADNLSLMSGVLSESDIKILKNLAGGGLIRTRSENRFRSDVGKIREKLSSELVVTVDEEKALRDQNKEIPEGTFAANAQGQRIQLVNGQWVEVQ
jgi:hypothetical protein